jgi:hypothetical protein
MFGIGLMEILILGVIAPWSKTLTNVSWPSERTPFTRLLARIGPSRGWHGGAPRTAAAWGNPLGGGAVLQPPAPVPQAAAADGLDLAGP